MVGSAERTTHRTPTPPARDRALGPGLADPLVSRLADPLEAAGRGRPGGTRPIQGFWLRNPDVAWREDTRFIPGWYEQATTHRRVYETVKYKRHSKRKGRDVVEPETRFTPTSLGWLPVYKPRAGVLARIDELDGWAARLGPAKARAVFATYDMALAGDRGHIGKHLDELVSLPERVVTGLMARAKGDLDSFFARLATGELQTYFAGRSPEAIVASNEEFHALASMVRTERAFGHAQVLTHNRTAAQGAHYLSEHGAHSSDFHTIKRAVEYGLRGGGAATKGNWVSNEAELAALEWARARAELAVQAAEAQNATPGSIAALPNFLPPVGVPLFGVPATPTASIHAAVNLILGANPAGPATFEHGDVSGSNPLATLHIQGDFTPEAAPPHVPPGPALVGAFGGNFTGTITGAPLGNGVAANNQALEVRDVTGSGNVAVDVQATAEAANRLGGRMVGRVTANGAQISARTGAGATARYFDGVGDYQGAASAPINGVNSTWTGGWGRTTTGRVHDQVLTVSGAAANNIRLRGAELVGHPRWNAVGDPLHGTATGYTPGIGAAFGSGGKVTNLQGDLTNHTAGATFQPQSLRDIVRRASVTGRLSAYRRPGAPATPPRQLLAPSLSLRGTLAQLQAGGAIPLVADLSGLTLQVANITRGSSVWCSDIAGVADPAAGTRYRIQLGAEWYCFDLVVFTRAPAQTNFAALLYLTGADRATYEPFTAYPVP